jgi:hypothetical protein
MARRTIGPGERERRRRLVARWRRSGRSAAEFAERHGISKWALYSWAKQPGAGPSPRRQKRRSVRGLTTAGAPGFIPVRLVGDGHADPAGRTEGVVEIQLSGGDVVRVVGEVSAERLRAVVTAVRQAC